MVSQNGNHTGLFHQDISGFPGFQWSAKMVTQIEYLLDSVCADILKDRSQCQMVAMNVGDDSNAHVGALQ